MGRLAGIKVKVVLPIQVQWTGAMGTAFVDRDLGQCMKYRLRFAQTD
jgi:hypothetical protein